MIIKEMKIEIAKVLEAVLDDGRLAVHEIERARFIHKDTLKHNVSDEQIQDMYGFITYCRNNSERFKDSFPGGLDNYISFNIAHDLYEFFHNHTKDWFSPRTKGYRKYIDIEATCRICGCTEQKACPGGCYWVEKDLCNQCRVKKSSKSC